MDKRNEFAQREPMTRKIFIGVPLHNGMMDSDCALALREVKEPHTLAIQTISLLAFNFNMLMIEAANNDHDWFVMVHGDVVPTSRGWVTTLIDMCERKKWRAISVPLAIKDDRGLTSTSVLRNLKTEKLSRTELEALPKTFGNAYSKENLGGPLLINTGLMAVDLRGFDLSLCHFHIIDKIIKMSDGKWGVANLPEDWNFSCMMNDTGNEYGITREVEAFHKGFKAW